MRPILLISLTTIFLISCGGGGSTPAVNPTPPVKWTRSNRSFAGAN